MAEEHLARAGKHSFDIAYGCFLFCGLFTGAFPISGLISEEVSFYYFWYVSIPLGPLFIGGMLVGIGYSIRLWRHFPLPFLSLVSLVSFAVMDSEIVGWAYPSIATALPAWWFIIGRRRFRFGTRTRSGQFMKIERTHVGWGFWFWWVLASTVGYAVSSAAAMEVLWAVVGAPEFMAKGLAPGIRLAVVRTGAVVGVLQWLVLRREVSGTGWWVLASIVGWVMGTAAAGLGLVLVGLQELSLELVNIVSGAVVGAAVGVLQWLVLRREVSGAGWWVLASIVGWVMGQAAHGAIGLPAVGAVSGAITGIALVRLLRQPIAEA